VVEIITEIYSDPVMFEVTTTMIMKSTAFFNVMSCNLVKFAELRRILLQSTQHHMQEDYLSQHIFNYGLEIITTLLELFPK
jgi:hypothetical protein